MIGSPRSWLVAVVAVVALVAAPAAASPLEPADLVGTWRGTARWTGCSVAGHAAVALPIAWRDGTYVIDLAPARDDLGEILLAPDGDGFTGHRDDLQVRFAPRGAPTLTLTSSADCTARLALTRASSGIAACDRVVALAAIEATCPAAGDPRAARQAAVASRAASWSRLRGARQRAAAAACTTEADGLADALTVAGCLPQATTGPVTVPACDAYLAALPRYARCPGVTASARRVLDDGARRMMRSLAAAAGAPAALERAGQVCEDAITALRFAAHALRCPL